MASTQFRFGLRTGIGGKSGNQRGFSWQSAVVVAPIVMLLASTIFVGGYQEQRGHWFFHLHDAMAGLALIPFYMLGSVIVSRGIIQRDYRLGSGTHFVVLLTLMAICLWYAFGTAFLRMATNSLGNNYILAIAAPSIILILGASYYSSGFQPQ